MLISAPSTSPSHLCPQLQWETKWNRVTRRLWWFFRLHTAMSAMGSPGPQMTLMRIVEPPGGI